MRGYLSAKFQTQRDSNFGDIIETVTGISVEEIGKLGLPSTVFRKGVQWKTHLEYIYLYIQLDLKDSKFLKLGFF